VGCPSLLALLPSRKSFGRASWGGGRRIEPPVMAGRPPSARLRGAGHGVVLGVPDHTTTAPSAKANLDHSDLSIQDMEAALRAKLSKRPKEDVRSNSGAQTARALLEENRQLIADKQERRAMARKNSREEFEKLVVQDRATIEGEKARALSRRMAQRDLAVHYKERIGDKESAKKDAYSHKRETADAHYFPFVEGETIDRNRQEKSAVMREEMRSHMRQQREDRPPRRDKLLEDMKGGAIDYPLDPRPVRHANGGPLPGGGAGGMQEQVSPHLQRHPRFLSRASEHMSRRLHDQHVRKALEDKVMQTKAELEAASSKREMESHQWQEGMLVNDALRYDRDKASAEARKQNADVLRRQMEEAKNRNRKDKKDRHYEKAGYWGPEEKAPQDPDVHREHCADLIKQMEVDQTRRTANKHQRLRQERQLIDNSMAEMSQDRMKEREKMAQHREVLTTTWHSQQKIKQALATIDAI